jgi:hypothetical protein
MGSHPILLEAKKLFYSQCKTCVEKPQPLGRNRCTATVAPVDHAVVMVLDQAGVFSQAFFEKGCDRAG